MANVTGKRRETLRIKVFIVAFMMIGMATGCATNTTTRYVDVKNSAGQPAKMEIKYKKNEIVSVTVPGEKVGERFANVDAKNPINVQNIIGVESNSLIVQGMGCTYCRFISGVGWRWYPPNCTCP